jgi:hypothetical protein
MRGSRPAPGARLGTTTWSTRLVEPVPIRHMPGREAETSDGKWMADLLGRRMLSPRFVPPGEFDGEAES